MRGSDPEAGSDLEAANGPCEVILKLSFCDPEVFCPCERSGSTFKLQFGKSLWAGPSAQDWNQFVGSGERSSQLWIEKS